MKNFRMCMQRRALGMLSVLLCCVMFFGNNARAEQSDERVVTIGVQQQKRTGKATGKVVDDAGEPLAGVTVQIVGTTRGVITGEDGKFEMDNVTIGAKLQVAYIGMQTQDIVFTGKQDIIVVLKEKAEELGEVTVVAFGKQKKSSVVASITTVNVKDLKVPTSNLTTSLAGNIAGVIAFQRSGEPGADDADFFVRGVTTFGTNTKPLILIDNVELSTTDLARLQPDDIESFSVMKDATATALYGTRGANGVIYVTTKKGKEGPAVVSFNLESSLSQATTADIGLVDPVSYMELANEAILTRNALGQRKYSDEKIALTRQGYNPVLFPANNWYNQLFNDYAINQRYNMSVSGGGTIARYYVSGSFTKDSGVLKVDRKNNFNNNINQRNYGLRANVNIDVTRTTELDVRLSANFDDYTGPVVSGSDMYKMVIKSNPVLFPSYYPAVGAYQYSQHILFGNADNNAYINPYAYMVRGYSESNRSMMSAQVEVRQKLPFILDGLNFRTMINISRGASYTLARTYDPFYYQLAGYDLVTGIYSIEETHEGQEYLTLSQRGASTTANFYLESVLSYEKTFNQIHDVSAALVFTNRTSLNPSATDVIGSLPNRDVGLSGRLTYGYNNRYFAEFNFGYNGSEAFSEENRFGFFPSVGVAWNVANEDFWADWKKIINNLKLRYTYGLVGGAGSARFIYIANVDMANANRAAYFGETRNYGSAGILVKRYANPNITWEVSKKQNYALELGVFDKLSIITEYYREYRSNILMTRSDIPTTMGLSPTSISGVESVQANVGEASTRGVDIALTYQQSWTRDLWSSARLNFTFPKSRYEVYEEIQYKEPWRQHAGRALSQNTGYIAERLFLDDEEVLNSPAQNFGSTVLGGDIKYTDVNGDGIISEADKVPIGYPTNPEIIYGFGLSNGYKNWTFSFFFQGSARSSFWIDPTETHPFYQNRNMLKVYADSHWSETNQDMYALWPRLSYSRNANNVQSSTWFMRDGAFLRLKQVELGYTIKNPLFTTLHIDNCRLYLSGSNLLTFSKFKLWDVEMGGNGLAYPIQRVFNIGLNLSFN